MIAEATLKKPVVAIKKNQRRTSSVRSPRSPLSDASDSTSSSSLQRKPKAVCQREQKLKLKETSLTASSPCYD